MVPERTLEKHRGGLGQQHMPEARKAMAKETTKVITRAIKATANGATHQAAERRAARNAARVIPRWETGGRAHHQTIKRTFVNFT